MESVLLGLDIFTSQIHDPFGLRLTDVAADFLEKIAAFWDVRSSLSSIVMLRRIEPKAPSFIIVIAIATAAVVIFGLDV